MLHGPAPQADYSLESGSERQFEVLIQCQDMAEISEKMARERSFDPDIWIVEVEDREGRSFITPAG